MDKRNQTCTIMPDNCRDEAWFMREFNAQFQAKFGINKTFTFAFMGSWSQSPLGINDPVQQEYWQQETQKLWEFSTERNETFEFMTIDDVLEENVKCKEENKRLHDIIDDNITELYQRMDDNELRVTENRDAIVVNTDLISDLETESKANLTFEFNPIFFADENNTKPRPSPWMAEM